MTISTKTTEEEKKEQCKKICGENPTEHRILCPYTLDRWKQGKNSQGGRLY